MISFIFLQMKVRPILSESEAAESNPMRLRDAGCLSPNCAPPARNRQGALSLDGPTSWQDDFSVSLEFSSRTPRGEVYMEQSSLGASHGGDTSTHARTHTREASSLQRPALLLCPCPQGLGSVAGERCTQTGEGGKGRERNEGAGRLRQTQVWGKDKGGCAGLGPSSGMQQVGLSVPWQGQRGQVAQPVPTRGWRPVPLTPFPVGWGTQLQKFPRFPAAQVAQPICLVKDTSTAGCSEGAEPQRYKHGVSIRS